MYQREPVPYSEEILAHLLKTARRFRQEPHPELRRQAEEAREELLSSHRRLIVGVARSYCGRLPDGQAEVAAEFAFLRAVDAYEGETEEVPFSALAEEWMRQEIEDTIRHQHWLG